jgi:hypothetical protein
MNIFPQKRDTVHAFNFLVIAGKCSCNLKRCTDRDKIEHSLRYKKNRSTLQFNAKTEK